MEMANKIKQKAQHVIKNKDKPPEKDYFVTFK